MNLSKNLIVALLGLGCYARSNSINLANNTTILLIILALLAKQNGNDDSNIEIANNTRTTVNTCPCANSANYNTATRVVYPQPYCYPANSGYCYGNQYQTVMPFQTTSAYPSACYVANNTWNTPRCHSHYTYPCHNVLY